ncbi:MAG TPA: DUF4398 domain-containing protein [Gammaproteobacteria bacterium]|nr:DUF4398 domain-containing protein [Gammaproteobacteria bacterium]
MQRQEVGRREYRDGQKLDGELSAQRKRHVRFASVQHAVMSIADAPLFPRTARRIVVPVLVEFRRGIRAQAWHGFCSRSRNRPKEVDMMKSTHVLIAASAFAIALLSACASKEPAASPQLTAVRQTIDQAQQADAQHYATREINMARSKLEAAEDAHEKGNEEQAANLAEQAKLDAEYAAAIAQNKEAQNAVTALNETLDTLRNELNTGSNAPSSGANPAPSTGANGASSAPSTGANPNLPSGAGAASGGGSVGPSPEAQPGPAPLGDPSGAGASPNVPGDTAPGAAPGDAASGAQQP